MLHVEVSRITADPRRLADAVSYVSTVPYNHYSLLRTIEDIFGLPHLGEGAMPQARPFGADAFG